MSDRPEAVSSLDSVLDSHLEAELQAADQLWHEMQMLLEGMGESLPAYEAGAERQVALQQEMDGVLRRLGRELLMRYQAQDAYEANETRASVDFGTPVAGAEPCAVEADGGPQVLGSIDHELPPPELPPPADDAVTQEEIEQFAANFESRGEHSEVEEVELNLDTKVVAATELLPDIKSRLGSPPAAVSDYPAFMGELGTLDSATSHAELDDWGQLPDEVIRCLVGYVAARLRHLQDEVPRAVAGASPVVEERMARSFSRLTSFMKTTWTGYVHGLARDHEPASTTWAADARDFQAKLGRLAEEYYGDRTARRRRDQRLEELAVDEVKVLLSGEWSRDELRALLKRKLAGGLSPDHPRLRGLLRPYRLARCPRARRYPWRGDTAPRDPRRCLLLSGCWPGRITRALPRWAVPQLYLCGSERATRGIAGGVRPRGFSWLQPRRAD